MTNVIVDVLDGVLIIIESDKISLWGYEDMRSMLNNSEVNRYQTSEANYKRLEFNNYQKLCRVIYEMKNKS